MTTASLPTLRDVARRAGVSIRTVRRVIAEEPYVAATVREKVRRILDATGYSPNPIARSLRTRTTTDILALVVAESPELSDFQVARILALESALWSAGFSLNVRFLRHGESTNGRALLQGSLARRPAGVAVFLAGHRDPRRLDSLLAGTRLPCVVVDAPAPAADHLTVDRPGGVQAAVRHLADRGRRRIAYLGQNDPTRLTGYLRALQELGLPAQHLDLPSSTDRHAQGRASAERVASLKPRPDAVQAYSDEMALGLLAGLHERGIRVPHEIAVIGFDDRHAASMVWPALTTLAHPNRELGEAAARRLLDRIAGRRPPNREPVPPLPMRLVIRESS